MTAGARPPLLRSPPFPGVAARIAAVSTPERGATVASDRPETLIAAMRAARVGGAFWAPPLAIDATSAIVLRPRSAAQFATMREQARALDGAPIIAVCPPARWAAGLGSIEPELAIIRGERDPWSILRPGTTLIADADDEWSLIGAIAGAARIDGREPDPKRALLADLAYRDCYSGAAAGPERAIAILAGWRRTLDANRAIAVASGMAWWKKPAIERFLWTGRAQPLAFEDDPHRAVAQARGRGDIALWPAKAPDLATAAGAAGVKLIAVEDGFIRSVGLGADLHPPLSIVVDREGIYYDPARPSDLETILATADFTPELIARAAGLRRLIVERGISKYASGAPPATIKRDARRIVLVAGQVEDDMSVRLAGGAIGGNLDLLRRARAAEPDARLLFKPHPDVDAGHRRGRVPDDALLAHADAIVRTEAMASLLGRVDAVHVLTSLTGFEALLRGREVIVHGQPFYAGWGLTTDLTPAPARRTRRLALDALVAGTLILYPRYLDPVTGLPCPPETLLERLADGWRPRWTPVIALRRLQGRIARALGTWTSGPRTTP